ncbi:MAG: hypothetical protein JRF63_15970, partial [Deltaproteobacteria bacterium]|nr:hypothetical protein [Deltaproteobacteria bacterium]
MLRFSLIALAIFITGGCWKMSDLGQGADGGDTGSDSDTDVDSDTDIDSDTDTSWEPPEDSHVYAQSVERLYMVSPSQGGQLELI